MGAFFRILAIVAKYGKSAVQWCWQNKGKILEWINAGQAIEWIVEKIKAAVGL